MAKPVRIGILYHPHNVDHSFAANHFAKLLEIPSMENEFRPGLLPTNFDADSLRRQLALQEDGEFDLYVVIGAFFTRTLSDIFKEIDPIPAIFIGVERPVELGVIDSLIKPNKPISGAIMESDILSWYAKILVACYPRYKTVLLPYKCLPSAGVVSERAEAIASALKKSGIKVFQVPINSAEEAVEVFWENQSQVDSVLLLEGCYSTRVAPYFIRLCYRQDKMLFANLGKAGVFLGAPFSYGPDFLPVIEAAVKMIHNHFDNRKRLETMSVSIVPNNRVLYINETVLRMLGETEEFIEKLRGLVDGKTIVMVKYWPMPPPEEEEDRPRLYKED